MRIKIAGLAVHTSTGTLSRLLLEWKVRCDVRSGADTAVEVDRAAQSLDAVGEADQAGTARGIRPAHAVVTDRQP
jgi:hypothetical protein